MWTFKQSNGQLFNRDNECIATGYAGGNCGKNPEGKNNPYMQEVPCVGPLPRGRYQLSALVPQSQLGPYAIVLTPAPTNEMFGRGHFYIHGDRTLMPGSASEGCIIMPRTVRQMMWMSDDHDLLVIA